jgi:uracil-DNA glycosylase family 4
MKTLREGLEVLERRLRYRLMAGGDHLPADLTARLLDLLEPVEGPLEEVARELGGCTRCPLHRSRHNIVVGEGNPRARLVFVGEGPGEEEDLQGRPFVGPAGQLLDRIIKAMGFTREEVFIGNVVKCRPPGNRTPSPEEVAACVPFLFRQLRAISPKVICALGGVSAQAILGSRDRISALRGRFHRWGEIAVMPTYHPSYLLRNPERKRDVWEDMQRVVEFLKRG